MVNEVVGSSGVQYAVIAGLHTETGHEHLVIAYPNEKSLRDLIAAPSIIAVGFSSREEAVAGGKTSAPITTPQQVSAVIAGGEPERYQHRLNWAERRGQTTLRRLSRFIVTFYSDVATAAIAIFFSSNAVSSVIRIALGSSV